MCLCPRPRTSFTLINRNRAELAGHWLLRNCSGSVDMEHNLSHVLGGICFEIGTATNDNNAFCGLSLFVYSNYIPQWFIAINNVCAQILQIGSLDS